MSVPDKFEFYHMTDKRRRTLYKAVKCPSVYIVSWDEDYESQSNKTSFSHEAVERLLKNGTWIMRIINNNQEAIQLLRKD